MAEWPWKIPSNTLSSRSPSTVLLPLFLIFDFPNCLMSNCITILAESIASESSNDFLYASPRDHVAFFLCCQVLHSDRRSFGSLCLARVLLGSFVVSSIRALPLLCSTSTHTIVSFIQRPLQPECVPNAQRAVR